MARIRAARIIPAPPLSDLRAVLAHGSKHRLLATFDDDTGEREVLRYYGDEISFTPTEVIGKTEEEVHQLFLAKDTAYLRS